MHVPNIPNYSEGDDQIACLNWGSGGEREFHSGGCFLPYIAILARLWLHSMGAVSSTLHVKVKYPTNEGVAELVGCQSVARQCMVAAVDQCVAKIGSSEVVPTW